MSNIKTFIAEEFLYSILSGDATLTGLIGSNKIHADIAPSGIAFPIITYRFQTYNDARSMNQNVAVQELMYIVAVTGKTLSYGSLKLMVDRMDDLLHKASGETTTGSVLACTFEEIYKQAYTGLDNANYRDLGGMYKLVVQ